MGVLNKMAGVSAGRGDAAVAERALSFDEIDEQAPVRMLPVDRGGDSLQPVAHTDRHSADTCRETSCTSASAWSPGRSNTL